MITQLERVPISWHPIYKQGSDLCILMPIVFKFLADLFRIYALSECREEEIENSLLELKLSDPFFTFLVNPEFDKSRLKKIFDAFKHSNRVSINIRPNTAGLNDTIVRVCFSQKGWKFEITRDVLVLEAIIFEQKLIQVISPRLS